MNTRAKKEKGRAGEEIAARYLEEHGYEIVERNYTVRGGEIDVIAKRDGALVFVEVKTRTDVTEGASLAVDEKKIGRLVRCAERYLYEKRESTDGLQPRFDCVEVYLAPDGGNAARIRHIENIDIN